MVTINVLIVTYKQENLIGRTLESILKQKEYGLNKIIICDDYSPDGNWSVIQRYESKYPDIIQGYRNDTNLGIYGNFKKLVSLRGNADFFYFMAGDDALCDGWFKKVQLFISEKNIIFKNKAVCIFSDWKICTPDNHEIIFTQEKVSNPKLDVKGLKLRGLVSTRSMLQSSKVVDQMGPIDLSRGLTYAEANYDMQPFIHTQIFYYCPFIASIYYNGIGVSTRMNTETHYKNYIEAYESLLSTYEWREKDVFYLKYLINCNRLLIGPSVILFFKTLWFYVRSMDKNYGGSMFLLMSVVKRMLKPIIGLN